MTTQRPRERSLAWSFIIRASIVFFYLDGVTSWVPFGGVFWTPPYDWYYKYFITLDPATLQKWVTDLMVWGHWVTGFVVAAVWLLIDRRRKHEELLYELAKIETRYLLGGVMLGFGFFKIFELQMGPPTPDMWPATFGEASTGFLMWNWLAISPSYIHFTGWVEVLCAALLFYRRTYTLGTLLTFVSLVIITVMQVGAGKDWGFFWTPGRRFFYVAFLIAGDWSRIRDFLFRATTVVPPMPRFEWPARWWPAFGWVSFVAFFALTIYEQRAFPIQWLDGKIKPAIAGLYEVEDFTVNGAALPPADGARRWRVISFDASCRQAVVRTMDDRRIDYTVQFTPKDYDHGVAACAEFTAPPSGVLTLKPGAPFESAVPVADTTPVALHYTRSAPDLLSLSAKVGNDSIVARARRVPDDRITVMQARR